MSCSPLCQQVDRFSPSEYLAETYATTQLDFALNIPGVPQTLSKPSRLGLDIVKNANQKTRLATATLPTVGGQDANSGTPEYFNDSVRSMTDTPVRSGITLGEIRPPRNLAPLSHAIGLEVTRTELTENNRTPLAGDAFARLILLHDPNGDERWEGAKMRLVAYIQADMEAAVATDPLLPEVAWDWLTEELAAPGAEHTDLGGTVTSTSSVRYGSIGGPPEAYQLEMRASWTAMSTDLSGHVKAFANVLANVAGLPPEGVSSLTRFATPQ